jgi:serine/threonine-protein phosphatase 2A regulatory subunit A
MQDQEAEVRVAAAEATVEFCSHVPLSAATFLADILLPLKNLATDSHQHVRCALASKALQLTPKCTALDESSAHMLDLILTLLKDKVRAACMHALWHLRQTCHSSARCTASARLWLRSLPQAWPSPTLLHVQVPEVRLNIISSLHHAQDVLSNERLRASVVPAIDDLSSDPHWRVRHAVITQLPLLARQLGVEFYESKLLQRNRDWLRDPVATIREAAMKVCARNRLRAGRAAARSCATPSLCAGADRCGKSVWRSLVVRESRASHSTTAR